MNPSTIHPAYEKPVDPDLAEQAIPGHGVPSQDPSSGAQVGLDPEEAERESKSTMMGGGVIAGSAAGAAIGVAVAGPVGVLIGGTIGAIAGALGGSAAGTLVDTNTPSSADDAAKDAAQADDRMPPR